MKHFSLQSPFRSFYVIEESFSNIRVTSYIYDYYLVLRLKCLYIFS